MPVPVQYEISCVLLRLTANLDISKVFPKENGYLSCREKRQQIVLSIAPHLLLFRRIIFVRCWFIRCHQIFPSYPCWIVYVLDEFIDNNLYKSILMLKSVNFWQEKIGLNMSLTNTASSATSTNLNSHIYQSYPQLNLKAGGS